MTVAWLLNKIAVMTVPPTYRAQSVSDLLNAVPTLFGFVPEESFIGVCLSGDRRRFGFRLRIDLPEPQDVETMARVVAGHLERGDGEAVLLIGLSADPEHAGRVVRAVAGEIMQKRIEFAIWANESRWWSNSGSQGKPWHRDPFHESVVKAVSHGQVIRPSRDSIAAEFTIGSEALSIAELERLQHAFDVEREREASVDLRAAIADVEKLLGEMGVAESMPPKDCAHIALWLRHLLVRDHFWFEINADNARRSLEQWTNIASCLSGRWRCAPLSLAAFCAWQTGDGVRTLLAAEAALQADSDYSLATLMSRVVEQGLPPQSWKQMRSSLRATG